MSETKQSMNASTERMSIVWQESESDRIDSQWAERALDAINHGIAGTSDTINKSRYVGAAIQFFYADDFLDRRERMLDKQLESEGVHVGPFQHELSIKGLSYTSISKDKLLDKNEFDSVPKERFTVSLPTDLKEYVEKAVEQSDLYDKKQKLRWICNAVIAFNDSIFSCRMERVETKEQILRVINGNRPRTEDMNYISAKIRDGEMFEDVYNSIFLEDTRWETDAGRVVDLNDFSIDNYEAISVPDGFMLGKDEGIGLKNVGRTRVGVMLGILENIVEEKEDGFAEIYLKTELDNMNEDIDSERLWEEYLKPEMTMGMDDMFYLYKENAPLPSEDFDGCIQKLKVAQDVKAAAKPTRQNRSIAAAIRNYASEEKCEEVKERSGNDGVKNVDALREVLSLDELEGVLSYMLQGLSDSHVERIDFNRDVAV